MKKFSLSIPKPCHENWEQMTPAEKGRFCGSCQKTVVDFTAMSNRQLAAFFKKPVGSVCGRLHKDQLNRAITAPRKRMPWLRYFFHVVGPALLLMLKSCGSKDRIAGDVVFTLSDDAVNEERQVATMGMPVIPEDSMPPLPEEFELGKVVADVCYSQTVEVMGDRAIERIENVQEGDSVETTFPIDSVVTTPSISELDTAFVEMDTVTVVGTAYRHHRTISCVLTARVIHAYSPVGEEPASPLPAVMIYPNPAKAGGVLNVKVAEKDQKLVSIQLLTSSGQRVLHKMVSGAALTAISVPLPSNLTQGIYFVQALYDNGNVGKANVIIAR